MTVASGARCPTHPDAAAVEVCQRCGAFVCAQCLELKGAQVFCPACAARQGAAGKASARAMASMVLGVCGLQCGFVWGLIALPLAYAELRAIESGEAPAAGKGLATAGKILGWINVVIIGIILIVVAIAFAAG
jgi:hypothetical protein